MKKPLLIRDVAEQLGVSVSRVAALDSRLNPARTPRGVRVYTQNAVDQLIGERFVTKGR